MAATGTVLDKPSWEILQPILDKTRGVHPGGLVYGLALDLGGSDPRALLAGSVCEMFYSACSVTDDLQDGDTDEYLGHVPLPLRINVQVQLICLVAVRLNELALWVSPDLGRSLLVDAYRTLSIMLTGQRLEITRDPWNKRSYEKVAELSAGTQFELYMKIAAAAADHSPDDLARLGHAIGTFLQHTTDEETDDDRLLTLGPVASSNLRSRFALELKTAAAKCESEFINREIDGLLKRCRTRPQDGLETGGEASPPPSTLRQ